MVTDIVPRRHLIGKFQFKMTEFCGNRSVLLDTILSKQLHQLVYLLERRIIHGLSSPLRQAHET